VTQNTGNGTRTITPIVYGVASTYGTKNLSQTANAQPGDLIVVNAGGAMVAGDKTGSILGGIIPTNIGLSGPLSALHVSVNGVSVSSSAASTVIPVTGQGGVVNLAFDSNIVNNLGTTNVYFNVDFRNAYGYNSIISYGGVYLVHCLNASGVATNCSF